MRVMQRKDISDTLVLKAYQEAKKLRLEKYPYEILSEWTGAPEKVCYRAMERAFDRDLIDYGTSLRSGWITSKGESLLVEGYDVQ